ncbi:MAG TPA: serine/threonine-protein kinase, partial [Candidatus Udaeobacter sp.]|nr:serine/threonine-protein kinase [Candidatus Udaeobacter sp.]
MSIEETERFERAARDAADGVVAPGDDAAGDATLENLRVLARVAQVHRAMSPRADAAGEDHDPGAPASEGGMLFSWGALQVLAPLGAGSFGEVYRALDPALGREVALKLMPPEESATAAATRRWLDEARRLALVRHPNVVQVYGAAIHDGRPGLWMELISGQTLEREIELRGPLGWREACAIGIELCAALAAVHRAGCVHQDVKAANVMREGGKGSTASAGRIVLMDFGAGQRLDPEAPSAASFATPLSSAPEVLEGAAPTPRSDLYSAGALLYRLVSGRHPIEGSNAAEILALARSRGALPLRDLRPDLPAAVVAAVGRALEIDPSRRWSSAAELERALVAALPDSTARSGGESRRPRAEAMALVAALILGVLGYALFERAGSPPAPADHGRASSGPLVGAPATVPPSASSSSAALAPHVDARLLRAAPGGAEEVRPGDLIAPGDQLALSIGTHEPLWLYVLDEDRTGHVVVLFPVANVSPANPIPPGRHRIPGKRGGKPLDWQVTSAGGSETFLFLASRTALPDLEARLGDATTAHEGATVHDARLESAPGTTRGVDGLAPSRIAIDA